MLERLLDSVILIDHFNDIEKATQFILALEPDKTAIRRIPIPENTPLSRFHTRSELLKAAWPGRMQARSGSTAPVTPQVKYR
jgi:hypothetical protein